MVAGKRNVAAIEEGLKRFVDVATPAERIANLGSAWGVEVVQCGHAIFGHTDGAKVGEVEVHFGGRFGAGCELKLDANAIDKQLGAGEFDRLGGSDEPAGAKGDAFAQAGVDMAPWTNRQQ